MRVIIIDDEVAMRLIIKKMIEKIEDIEVLGTFEYCEAAYDYLIEHPVDMVLTDINMPGEDGLEFARRITRLNPDILLVFLTAHKEYAFEAFEVYAFDYILKPVSSSRLEGSIKRAQKRLAVYDSQPQQPKLERLKIYCFGCFDVVSEGGTKVQFSTSKSMELLAYLLLKRGKYVSKWRIIEDVFGDMPPQNAETYLNTSVYKLRKTLEPFGLKGIILVAEGRYKIDLKDVYVDFIEFDCEIGIEQGIINPTMNTVQRVMKLYEGELYGDKDYVWAMPERERYLDAYRDFSKRAAESLINSGNYNTALQILKKMETLNELDESICCLLLKVYGALNDLGALNRQFQRYKANLQKELKLQPEKSVTELYERLQKELRM